MVFHVFGIRLVKFIVQFSYMCTQEDANSMYSSVVLREIEVASRLEVGPRGNNTESSSPDRGLILDGKQAL